MLCNFSDMAFLFGKLKFYTTLFISKVNYLATPKNGSKINSL
jgi:hypothetical protein